MAAAALTFSQLDHLMMGGGGGAGHASDVAGGAGGGILFVRAGTLAGTGTFLANGSTSPSATDAASGGGAGGTIYLRVAGSAVCGSIQATGGAGGSTGGSAIGPGGGGGGGRILFQVGTGSTCTLPGTAVIGANPGSQLDPGAPGGAAYGAQAGVNGSTTLLSGGFPLLAAPAVDTPANGSRTNNTRPTYSGTLAGPIPSGTEVVIYVDGVELARVTPDASGNWAFTPPGAVAELSVGAHTVSALAVNTAQGVQSAPSATNTFTVDLTPPTVVVEVPADGARLKTTPPVYSGTISDDSPGPYTVTIIVDGNVLGNATVTGNTWTFTPTTALGEGPHRM